MIRLRLTVPISAGLRIQVDVDVVVQRNAVQGKYPWRRYVFVPAYSDLQSDRRTGVLSISSSTRSGWHRMDAPRDKAPGGEVSLSLRCSKVERAFPLSEPASQTHRLLASFSFINNIRKVIKGALHCVFRSNNCFASHLLDRMRLCAGFVAQKRGQATSRKDQQLCLSASGASRLLQPGCFACQHRPRHRSVSTTILYSPIWSFWGRSRAPNNRE